MRKILALLLLIFLSPLGLIAQQKRLPEQKPIAITHVTIIDATGAPPSSDMTLIIAGGRIAAIGKNKKLKVPKDAQVIDATGKFLIPGLWDMHAHTGDEEFDKKSHLSLFIANGVTGIRLMSGLPEHHLWRKDIERGTLTGPRMVIASGRIDESKTSEEEARQAARRAKQEGADFFKVYDDLPRGAYFALVKEAGRLGLPVEGHVPASITAGEASEAGQKSIEHLTGLAEAKSDDRKAETVLAVFKKNRTWQCPTLIMRHNYASLDDVSLASDSRLKYVKPSWKERWLTMTNQSGSLSAADWAARKQLVRKEKDLVGKMQKAGLGILAGTDDANPYCIPGFSLHDELAMLVDAGLTPMQALQAATLNPAKFLNKIKSLGTVEEGKLADLVLLDANPLDDIRNTNRINAVVVNGRFLYRKDLDHIFADIETAARKSKQR
jgi:imidazolonepropionase-like amidohydrolase